jgi:hypothetical protein
MRIWAGPDYPNVRRQIGAFRVGRRSVVGATPVSATTVASVHLFSAGVLLILGIGLLLCVGPVLRDKGRLISWTYRIHKRLPITGRLYRDFDTYRYVAAIPFIGMGSIFVVLGLVLLARAIV